jgi:hypothetical protein
MARRSPVPIAVVDFGVLDAVSDPDDKESLQMSLDLSVLSASDLRKPIAIIRETVQPNGKLTSFGLTAHFLGRIKAAVSEQYYRYLGEQAHDPRPPGHSRKLAQAMEEAITVKATEYYETRVACVYFTFAGFVFDAFGLVLSNQPVRLTVKSHLSIKTVLTSLFVWRLHCVFVMLTWMQSLQCRRGARVHCGCCIC